MVEKNLHFNLETIFQEVLKRREDNAAYNREAYDQFVEDILEEKLDRGELDSDNDIEGWTAELKNRWPEVEQIDAEKADGGEID